MLVKNNSRMEKSSRPWWDGSSCLHRYLVLICRAERVNEQNQDNNYAVICFVSKHLVICDKKKKKKKESIWLENILELLSQNMPDRCYKCSFLTIYRFWRKNKHTHTHARTHAHTKLNSLLHVFARYKRVDIERNHTVTVDTRHLKDKLKHNTFIWLIGNSERNTFFNMT